MNKIHQLGVCGIDHLQREEFHLWVDEAGSQQHSPWGRPQQDRMGDLRKQPDEDEILELRPHLDEILAGHDEVVEQVMETAEFHSDYHLLFSRQLGEK